MSLYASSRKPDPDAAHDEQKQREGEILLCRDCVNYQKGDCFAPKNLKRDFINGGKTNRNSISFLRESDSHCGESAAWFSPKLGKAA